MMLPSTKDNDSLSDVRQRFFLCEILHSRELSSIIATSSTAIDEREGHHNIIICHKDRTSFYKSTRKASRSAFRIWSAFSNTTIHGQNFDTCGYFVGKAQRSSLDSGNGENAAIHKRLSSEFGPCSALNIDVLNPNLEVTAFNSASQSKERSQQKRMNVIFLDLDAIDSTATMESNGSAQNTHYDTLQKSLSLIMQEMNDKGKNSIVHVRSEQMYHTVSSTITSIESNHKSRQKAYCVSGEELEKYLLSKRNESEMKENEMSSSNVIRRLREKKGAAHCPLTIYPTRFVELSSSQGCGDKPIRTIEICRFHNYDAERGCLRSKKAHQNSEVKGCDMDHDHCHRCGGRHRAFECPVEHSSRDDSNLSSVVFRKTADGSMVTVPLHDQNLIPYASPASTSSLPALLVLGGRLRGRTLATCEMLPLGGSSSNNYDETQWMALPNLHEHRGSHAACSPAGSGLVFVLGGGTQDGNSDTVEILDFGLTRPQSTTASDGYKNNQNGEWRWHTMAGKLSSPRHAFGAVSCMTGKHIFSVGGWKYGSMSCESTERLTLEYPNIKDSYKHRVDSKWLHDNARWKLCAPLILPRRLHSVAASSDGSSIFVFGGYIDGRRTTSSIERYDIRANGWSSSGHLPYGEQNCPLVQAVADQIGFLVFPYNTEQTKECEAPSVLRFIPGSDTPFSPALVPNNDNSEECLHLPIANWHSFSVTSSLSLKRAFLVGGTILGKWTDRSFELDLDTMKWKELPRMTFARRRLAITIMHNMLH